MFEQKIIQINSYIPPLYRYLEKQFVGLFFTMGILRISSFDHFANHPDETRLDTQEGRAKLIGNCKDNNMRIEMGFGVGNSFVLCTSLIKSKKLANKFKADGCFKIKDFFNFYSCISNTLSKNNYIINGGLYGPCRYEDKRELVSIVEQTDIDRVMNSKYCDPIFDLGRKLSGNDTFFLKLNNYAD